jgi:hypothetical protein
VRREVAEEVGRARGRGLRAPKKTPKQPFVAVAMTEHLGAATQCRTFGLNCMVSGKGCSTDTLAASSLHARAGGGGRLHRAGGTAAPSLVPTYASVAYGCALAHSPQTTREVRATFYSRLSQYSPHAASCTCVGHFCPHGPGGGPPALHARFPSVPTSGVRSPVIHQFPHLGFGFDPRRDSIYDKSLTGEPILPSRTADQYLARYWSAVRDGKIGSPVRDLSV